MHPIFPSFLPSISLYFWCFTLLINFLNKLSSVCFYSLIVPIYPTCRHLYLLCFVDDGNITLWCCPNWPLLLGIVNPSVQSGHPRTYEKVTWWRWWKLRIYWSIWNPYFFKYSWPVFQVHLRCLKGIPFDSAAACAGYTFALLCADPFSFKEKILKLPNQY